MAWRSAVSASWCSLALYCAASSVAFAQVAPAATPPDGDNTVEEVVVEATQPTPAEQRKLESDFAREQSAPTRRSRLARWSGRVCPGVVGLSQAPAAYLAERVSEEARKVGLDVGSPGCSPDILILVTSRATKTAYDFRAKHPAYFAQRNQGAMLAAGGGGQRLQSFLTSSKPVRWWHVARLTGADGQPLSFVQLDAQDPTSLVPAVLGTGASRLRSFVREDLTRAVIVVDTTQLAGVTHEQLASYVAMVSLAQLDPEAAPATLPSILSLFRNRDEGWPFPEALTAYDKAYLRGLYQASDSARTLHVQRGAIRRSLEQVSSAGR